MIWTLPKKIKKYYLEFLLLFDLIFIRSVFRLLQDFICTSNLEKIHSDQIKTVVAEEIWSDEEQIVFYCTAKMCKLAL